MPAALTISQAATELNVCRTTIYALLQSGDLQSFRVYTRQRIPAASIDAFIASRLSATP